MTTRPPAALSGVLGFVALATVGALGACARERPAPEAAPAAAVASAPEVPPTPAASSARAAATGALVLGEPITSPLVTLAAIAKSPARYEDQVVSTRGKVTAVCQAMGCWMELEDESGHAHVKMHGHSFFVPKTAAGHLARVQARVLRSGAAECADSPPPKGSIAKVELDATGIELD